MSLITRAYTYLISKQRESREKRWKKWPRIIIIGGGSFEPPAPSSENHSQDGRRGGKEAGLSARAESCEMQLCGFDEKGPQRPGLSTALSQRRGCPRRRECGRLGRRASCLFVAQVHFRPAACKYWLPPFSSFLTHGPDPFPSFAASLFFFTGTLFTSDDAMTMTMLIMWLWRGKFAV